MHFFTTSLWLFFCWNQLRLVIFPTLRIQKVLSRKNCAWSFLITLLRGRRKVQKSWTGQCKETLNGLSIWSNTHFIRSWKLGGGGQLWHEFEFWNFFTELRILKNNLRSNNRQSSERGGLPLLDDAFVEASFEIEFNIHAQIQADFKNLCPLFLNLMQNKLNWYIFFGFFFNIFD